MSKNNRYKTYDGFPSFGEETNETPESPVEEELMEPTTRKGKLLNTILVNLREYPSRESRVVGFVQKDVEFEILDESSEWTQINYEGTVGWIMSSYLKEVF